MIRKVLAGALVGLFSLAAVAASKVDLNSATAAELAEALDGVGEVRAQAIVDYRDANGAFASVGALIEVNGIGEATLEANRERLVVGTE